MQTRKAPEKKEDRSLKQRIVLDSRLALGGDCFIFHLFLLFPSSTIEKHDGGSKQASRPVFAPRRIQSQGGSHKDSNKRAKRAWASLQLGTQGQCPQLVDGHSLSLPVNH